MKNEEKNLNKILYVDDEEAWRVVFKRNLQGIYEVITAKSADEGWDLLKKHSNEIAIIVSDQRMPGRPGIELLKQARAYYPRIIRILTTGFSDSTIAIHATNQGAVYHYVSKPWNAEELLSVLKRAMDFQLIRKERDNLLERKLSSIQRKNLESKLQSLLVFGDSKNGEIHNATNAVNCYLKSILLDPGKIFSLKSIYKNSQNELSVLTGHFQMIQELMEISARLRNVDDHYSIDPRRMLLRLRDVYPQIIFSVQQVDLKDKTKSHLAEKVLSHYLEKLVLEWMKNNQENKLLEIAEKPSTSKNSINEYTLRIGFFNDPVPYEVSDEDDSLYNGINLEDSQEIAWLRFLFVIYHFGGQITIDMISGDRLAFTVSGFHKGFKLPELTSESVAAELFNKFEAWNFSIKSEPKDSVESAER